MSFYASLILFTNVSCLITSDIQPEPQQLVLKMQLMIQKIMTRTVQPLAMNQIKGLKPQRMTP